MDPSTGKLVPGGVAAEAAQALKNMGAVLAAAGTDYGHVIKTTIFLADMADFVAVNEVYKGYFAQPYPARSCVQAAGLPANARVEIEAVAMVGEVVEGK